MKVLRLSLTALAVAAVAGCGSTVTSPSAPASTPAPIVTPAATPTPSATAVPTATATADPTAGWLSYQIPWDKSVSFTHPASWQVTVLAGEETINNNVYVTAPDGTRVTFTYNVGMIGGACGSTSPDPAAAHVASVTPLAASAKYDVAQFNTPQQRLQDAGIVQPSSYHVGEQLNDCPNYLLFPDPQNAADRDAFGTSFQVGLPTENKAVPTQDVATVVEIVSSMTVS